ncbi:hypothetical protein Lal_00010811 [Lupinus albus]|nr:hypothetical protein Lal_00010811 [Lupinus albus]
MQPYHHSKTLNRTYGLNDNKEAGRLGIFFGKTNYYSLRFTSLMFEHFQYFPYRNRNTIKASTLTLSSHPQSNLQTEQPKPIHSSPKNSKLPLPFHHHLCNKNKSEIIFKLPYYPSLLTIISPLHPTEKPPKFKQQNITSATTHCCLTAILKIPSEAASKPTCNTTVSHNHGFRGYFSEPEFLFFQNLNCTDLCSNIFSTSSIGTPLVSGTKIMTKKMATTATIPNIMNVHAVPIASVNDKKDWETMRLETHTAVDAIPPQTPLYLKGYISELITHGTVPIPVNFMQDLS